MADPGDRDRPARTLGPAVAGTWYPSGTGELERQVDGLLRAAADSSDARPGPSPSALIAPHAGFVYSGAVAGKGFSLVRDQSYERVILLGPSHYASFQGAGLPSAEAYRTPLGTLPIDTETIARIGQRPGMRIDDGPFEPEHCLEAELPFLQRSLAPGWLVIPVLMGGGGGSQSRRQVVEALAPIVDERTLVVVSSDFTHYGPRFGYVPFRDLVPERIRRLDMGAVERILHFDRQGFDDYVAETGATICGRAAIDVLLGLLEPGATSELVAYDTSGRMTGDWDHSVSYASLAFRN
jgi:AmmeMemoRadiSam system protein B